MGGPSEVRQLIIIDIAATRMIDIIWGVVNEMKFAHVTREPLHTAVRHTRRDSTLRFRT